MITKSLNEDIQTGDITAEQFVLPTESVTASIVSKDTGLFLVKISFMSFHCSILI